MEQRLADAGIATLRYQYQFPYMERGGSAVVAAYRAHDLILLAGGHTFGGRMTSRAAAEAPT